MLVLLALTTFGAAPAAAESPTICSGGPIAQQRIRIGEGNAGLRTALGAEQQIRLGGADQKNLPAASSQPDLLVTGACTIGAGQYAFNAVNITQGGSLTFVEPKRAGLEVAKADALNAIDFRAYGVIIENGGAMCAGVGDVSTLTAGKNARCGAGGRPFGTDGAVLTITLYGADQSMGKSNEISGQGILCATPTDKPAGIGDCGIPTAVWTEGQDKEQALPGNVTDFFYQYGSVFGDDAAVNGMGHFGYKSIGLSYGGVLEMHGAKGTSGGLAADSDVAKSGTSWVRLGADVKAGATQIELDRPVAGDWKPADEIVVTSTDYIPGHSEQLKIRAVDPNGTTITLEQPVRFDHVGRRYDLTKLLAGGRDRLHQAGMDADLLDSAETRAAVALLTRSIRIVSGGDTADESFADATRRNPHYSFGGHTVFRQGFEKLQVQGVEFAQLGQGGKLAHYPVHFHMARQTPVGTYVKDSSVNESMTRWYVLHSTLGVTLARNVGYLSIGHGFFLEDGTETNNRLLSNLGIYARAAVVGPDNPRNIAGIFAQNGELGVNGDAAQLRYRSDIVHPTVFWITNGWNEFVGNMAVGAGTCGACFWLVPQANHDMAEVMDGMAMPHMKWKGYSAIQGIDGHAGTSPLKAFYRNYCSTAMHSFNTVGSVAQCSGLDTLNTAAPDPDKIQPIRGIAPAQTEKAKGYYPYITDNRTPTTCDETAADADPTSCVSKGTRGPLCNNTTADSCSVTVIDHYTSSFNWAETNFSAVWLRGGWNMMDNSFLSDVQNGGVTIISGGDYSRASAPLGFWGLLSRSVLAGETQKDNPFALAGGPFNAASKALGLTCLNRSGAACVSIDESITFPLTNFGTNQRLFNIYDGPAFQDANAYVSIRVSPCSDSDCIYWGKPGIRKNPGSGQGGYLPNAAIGWKQPNGFYYPPAFHSRNLLFSDVDIRHYVIEPLTIRGTYRTNVAEAMRQYAGLDATLAITAFGNFTDVDRQTELNDDDGTLTGFADTVSVNEDAFFRAPLQTAECKSNIGIDPAVACAGKLAPTPATARTSPYDYVTTVIYPGCAIRGAEGAESRVACGNGTNDVVASGVGSRFSAMVGRGGTWSSDCTGPFCYGVPIYRQYLVGEAAGGQGRTEPSREWADWLRDGCSNPVTAGKEDCRYPFARMAGTNTYQRSIMTVNNGSYYIDTTRSKAEQDRSDFAGLPKDPFATYVDCADRLVDGNCQPHSVNVFEAGQTYYLFLLFAKKTTRQTYQFYVGADFKPATDLKGARGVMNLPFAIQPYGLPKGWQGTMIAGADPAVKDVLSVTLDFAAVETPNVSPGNSDFISLDPANAANKLCQPASFCSWTGSTCGCSMKADDPRLLVNPGLRASCQSACADWATKDLDCPDGRCLGIAFTLPASFKAENQYKRPQPTPFPSVERDPIWSRLLFKGTRVSPDNGEGGDCHYAAANVPGTKTCPVAD